jgi:uncharacterized protein (DUF58 family)
MKSLRKFFQIRKGVKQHATRFSLVVVIFLFGLFMEAYMHDFNLVYVTLFFLFSFAFSAGPIGVMNLGRLEANFLRSGRFFAHREGNVSLRIHNNSNATSWSVLLRHEAVSVALPKLKGESSATLHLPFTPQKRGAFIYEKSYMESKYPLSTVRLTRDVPSSYLGVAYPQPKGKSLQAFLNEEETFYGEEKEFDGLREYDGSQRLSRIHWASVAKGVMSVKVFTKETRTPNLVFTFETLQGEEEARLSQLCLWVLECERQRLPFSVQMPHKRLSFPKESIDEILERLAKH